MILFLIHLIIFHISSTQYADSQRTETNDIDVTPLYNTIIFSDITDVINEFENNINEPSDINSESESGENMEDLLSEYQHYLDKAHKQKQIYIEKSKTKNKVPLLRHEKFMKTKNNAYKNDSLKSSYFNPSIFTFSHMKYSNPLDFFIPLNYKTRHSTNPQVISEAKGINNNMDLDKTIVTHNRILESQPIHISLDRIKSCCCKTGQLPCSYNCKQCLTTFKPFTGENFAPLNMADNKKYSRNPVSGEGFFKTTQNNIVDQVNSFPGNTINFRIKVDISVPKTSDYYGQKVLLNTNEHDDISKEILANVNIPLPYYNYPISTDMFGYNKIFKLNKPDSGSLNKMTLHKKRKSRVNNKNKNHHRKLITYHNINLEPKQFFNTYNGNNGMHSRSNNNNISDNSIALNATEKTEFNLITRIPNNTISINNTNNNQTHEEIYLTVNITKSEDKTTEDSHKIENSIENEYTTKINLSDRSETPTKLRLKRDISFTNITSVLSANNNESQVTRILKTNKSVKKNDKMVLNDNKLLYWPNNYGNSTDVKTKNITAIILVRENKKAKLNISNETIRRNHTRALEQAIFGEVDWNDMDTVAPTFMSFVGKYITGALTFCSEIICHSMKCESKTCVHRVCAPKNRLNNIGHCTGSKNTDSVASMESVMDLPSNVAFEIVDILQDKMLGKIFGKSTLCITPKCITMTTQKKIFKKTKCTIKELRSTGHCTDTKSFKMP